MSRIGRLPIEIPDSVKITISDHQIQAAGPKGALSFEFHSKVKIKQEDKKLIVEKIHNDKLSKSLHGLTQRLVQNIIIGVSQGFEKKLEIKGVGYRAQATGKAITLNVGYSHSVEMTMPEGIEVKVQKNTIIVSGINKQLVGEIAAQIRAVRKPEPYKGKGIRYIDEVVKRKAGKAAKSAGAGA